MAAGLRDGGCGRCWFPGGALSGSSCLSYLFRFERRSCLSLSVVPSLGPAVSASSLRPSKNSP
jgi:hypothetical protein